MKAPKDLAMIVLAAWLVLYGVLTARSSSSASATAATCWPSWRSLRPSSSS